MKRIGLLLHWYQPPWQYPEMLARIATESYLPLVRVLGSPSMRATVNINFSLTEQLVRDGHEAVLTGLIDAAHEGRVDFCDSGAYHPILPLIPASAVLRQLSYNRDENAKVFGRSYRPDGVFPPEMAFDPHLAPLLRSLDYAWAITEDVAVSVREGSVPMDYVMQTPEGLTVPLRSNFWSNHVAFERRDGADTARAMGRALRERFGSAPAYLIIAMDAETFGHHQPEYWRFLEDFADTISELPDVEMASVGDIVRSFPAIEANVPACSWSVLPEDVCSGNPFPLWDDGSEWHRAGWGLIALASATAERHPELTLAFDRASSSCAFWWLSRGHWAPQLATRGFKLLVDVVQAGGDDVALERALDLYARISATQTNARRAS